MHACSFLIVTEIRGSPNAPMLWQAHVGVGDVSLAGEASRWSLFSFVGLSPPRGPHLAIGAYPKLWEVVAQWWHVLLSSMSVCNGNSRHFEYLEKFVLGGTVWSVCTWDVRDQCLLIGTVSKSLFKNPRVLGWDAGNSRLLCALLQQPWICLLKPQAILLLCLFFIPIKTNFDGIKSYRPSPTKWK